MSWRQLRLLRNDVEELRALLHEARAEIERLRARVEELEAAYQDSKPPSKAGAGTCGFERVMRLVEEANSALQRDKK